LLDAELVSLKALRIDFRFSWASALTSLSRKVKLYPRHAQHISVNWTSSQCGHHIIAMNKTRVKELHLFNSLKKVDLVGITYRS
jgi:hypothetical protein